MKAVRMWAIVLKELRQLRRDRITAAMIVGIPAIQLMLFGFAINLDVRGIDAAIADQAGTSASRAVVQDLLATGVIAQRAEARTPGELMQLLRRGRISVGVVIPPDFDRRLAEGREAVQVLVDGSEPVCKTPPANWRSCRWTATPDCARVRSAWSVSITRSDARPSTWCQA